MTRFMVCLCFTSVNELSNMNKYSAALNKFRLLLHYYRELMLNSLYNYKCYVPIMPFIEFEII